jgi:hypothetical protein
VHRRHTIAATIVLAMLSGHFSVYAAKGPTDPVIDRNIEKIVSGPFVGPASKPTHGLYLKASPNILSGTLRIDVLQANEVVLNEKLVVPASVTKATAVVFLAHVGGFLDELRKADAAAPGSVVVSAHQSG